MNFNLMELISAMILALFCSSCNLFIFCLFFFDFYIVYNQEPTGLALLLVRDVSNCVCALVFCIFRDDLIWAVNFFFCVRPKAKRSDFSEVFFALFFFAIWPCKLIFVQKLLRLEQKKIGIFAVDTMKIS